MCSDHQLIGLASAKARYSLPTCLLSVVYGLCDIDTRRAICQYLDKPGLSGCYYLSEAYLDCTQMLIGRRVVAPSRILIQRHRLTAFAPSYVHTLVDGAPQRTLEDPPISLKDFAMPKRKVFVLKYSFIINFVSQISPNVVLSLQVCVDQDQNSVTLFWGSDCDTISEQSSARYRMRQLWIGNNREGHVQISIDVREGSVFYSSSQQEEIIHHVAKGYQPLRFDKKPLWFQKWIDWLRVDNKSSRYDDDDWKL